MIVERGWRGRAPGCYLGAMTQADAVAQPRLSSETLAYAGLLATTLMWASAFIAGKVVLREMEPLTVGALRHTIAGLALLPLALRQPPSVLALRSVALPLAVMVLSSGVLYPWLFLEALARTDATNCSLLIALNPLFTVVLAPLVGGPRHHRWAGILLALAGAALVITRGELAHLGRMAQGSLATGDLMALAAALTWAAFNLASRSVVAAVPAAVANVLVYGLGGTMLLFWIRDQQPLVQWAALSPAANGCLLFMAVIASGLAGQIYLYGVRVVGVNRTVVFIYLVPVLTALLSVLLLGERLVAAQVLGGAAVLLGVYWTTQR